MKLAVLLTCHDRKSKTLTCLNAIYNQNKFNSNLIIYLVDDGCTDGTSESVKNEFPNVKLIRGDGDLFWNRGMILAWETALKNDNWDAVVWLNDDTILASNAFEVLSYYAELYSNSIIVGSVSSLTDANIFTYGGYLEKYHILKPKDSAIECKFFNGNIVLVPRTVSDKIGILDKHFHHSLGDFEYGLRAHKYGIHSYVTPIIGKCDRNPLYTKWVDTKYNLVARLKFLYSPLGNNPFETFLVERYFSLGRACATFIYLHAKAFFPSIFKHRSITK